MEPFNWKCEYCGHNTTITEPNWSSENSTIYTGQSIHGNVLLQHVAIACPNQECGQLTLDVFLMPHTRSHLGTSIVGDPIKNWKLLPRSRASAIPTYVPEAIRNDYEEACLIINDSPKAAASLSRRCLQGMVRDFWKLKKTKMGNLASEIAQIEEQVSPDTWDSIEAIRSVGNIGAHMEKDVNLIIDVEPNEAELLIELIEMLIEDWYIDRHKRQERTKKAKALVADKKAAKQSKQITKEHPETE